MTPPFYKSDATFKKNRKENRLWENNSKMSKGCYENSVCVVECVWVWKKYKYLCDNHFLRRISLHFFHDTILAHLSSNVKSLSISHLINRRQSLTSTRFKSDETFYKIICKIVIVYRNFINRITRSVAGRVWTGWAVFRTRRR